MPASGDKLLTTLRHTGARDIIHAQVRFALSGVKFFLDEREKTHDPPSAGARVRPAGAATSTSCFVEPRPGASRPGRDAGPLPRHSRSRASVRQAKEESELRGKAMVGGVVRNASARRRPRVMANLARALQLACQLTTRRGHYTRYGTRRNTVLVTCLRHCLRQRPSPCRAGPRLAEARSAGPCSTSRGPACHQAPARALPRPPFPTCAREHCSLLLLPTLLAIAARYILRATSLEAVGARVAARGRGNLSHTTCDTSLQVSRERRRLLLELLRAVRRRSRLRQAAAGCGRLCGGRLRQALRRQAPAGSAAGAAAVSIKRGGGGEGCSAGCLQRRRLLWLCWRRWALA